MNSSLISFLLLGLSINFIFFNTLPIFAITYPQEDTTSNQLAEKYCDSLGKNLFTGLDNESTLKYLKNYFKTKSNTPNIKVEATNPTPTNPAIIPVLR